MHLILQAAAVEIAARTAREQVEVVFRLLNHGEEPPDHTPLFDAIIQYIRLRAVIPTLFNV